MPRPPRDGVDYFPFDVGLLRDKKVKLIKGEFGALGVVIYLTLLSAIYEENGYYKSWTDDDYILIADEVGCGCTRNNVAEVLQGCVKRSLFDEGVFNVFGVLTSAGIQRRFMRAASQRADIPIYQEYWLLDIDDRKDVPPGIRGQLAFKSISTNVNPNKTDVNPKKTPDNPQIDREIDKDNERESESKGTAPPTGDARAGAGRRGGKSDNQPKHRYGEFKHVLLTDTQRERLCDKYGQERTYAAIRYLDEYIQMKGYKAQDHSMAIQKWVFRAMDEEQQRENRNNRRNHSQSGGNPFYDIARERGYVNDD